MAGFNVALALPLVSPMVMTLVLAPKAFALPEPITVPALMVNPPVKVLAPERERLDVALFWITPVTLLPMTALIVVVPLPMPELVIVPELLIGFVVRLTPPLFVLLIVMLPVPVIPPVIIISPVELENNIRLLFKVIAPLRVGPLGLEIVNVPLLP